MEQIEYNLLFRWFIGLGMDDAVWDATTFSKNRERLLEGEIAHRFFAAVVAQARSADLMSDEHFTVDGTFLEAWASQKSFKPKDGSGSEDPNQSDGGKAGRNPSVDFRGQTRCNDTHASITEPDARLRKKGGDGAKLVHHGHLVTENRHGLVVSAIVTKAEGNAEVEAALHQLANRKHGTVAADKGYDQQAFVDGLTDLGMVPHVAQNTRGRASRIDDRIAKEPGYAISQRRRKMIEEVFGWMKTIGLMRKVRHRGTDLVGWMFEFTAAAYNLVRLRRLLPPAAPLRAAA
jgi:IS5 family transposase